jgi:hypothetical protein
MEKLPVVSDHRSMRHPELVSGPLQSFNPSIHQFEIVNHSSAIKKAVLSQAQPFMV